MKTKLKHFINVPTNLTDETIGKIPTHYMVWSPVHHSWFYPTNFSHEWVNMSNKEKKFLLKQEVIKVSLRNDEPYKVALFLKDYGKEKNKILKERIKRGRNR